MELASIKHLLFGKPCFYRLLRIFVAGVFIWSGAAKLISLRAFAQAISGYGLVPEELLVTVAIGLPLLELLAGAGLLFDLQGSLKIIAGLLAIFMVVLGYAIARDLNVDCGCFSPADILAKNNLRSAFLRDAGLMIIVLYLGLWRIFRRRSWMLGDSNQN